MSPSLWLPISCLINPCRRLFYTPFSQCHRRLTLRGQKRLPFFFSLLLLRLDLAYCLTTMPPLCYVCVNSSHFFKRLKACERITQTAFSAETPIFREVLCSSKFVSKLLQVVVDPKSHPLLHCYLPPSSLPSAKTSLVTCQPNVRANSFSLSLSSPQRATHARTNKATLCHGCSSPFYL